MMRQRTLAKQLTSAVMRSSGTSPSTWKLDTSRIDRILEQIDQATEAADEKSNP